METNKTKNSKSHRVVAGVAIAAAAFTGMGGGITIVAPDYAAQAQAAESGIWKYKVVDDHVELRGLTSEGKQQLKANGGKLTDFPESINGQNVTRIGYSAFKEYGITELPNSWKNIEWIDHSAFFNNKISSLPSSWGKVRYIGEYAFGNNNFQSINTSLEKVFPLGNTISTRIFEYNSLTVEQVPADRFVKNNPWSSIYGFNPYYPTSQIEPGASLSIDARTLGSSNRGIGGFRGMDVQITSIPDGWSGTVNSKDGKLSVTAPKDAKAGDIVEFELTWEAFDGDVPKRPLVAKFIVTDTNADLVESRYTTVNIKPGGSATSTQTEASSTGKFYMIDGSKMPKGWIAMVDNRTGLVTAYSPDDAEQGSVVDIPVEVYHKDGSVQSTVSKFKVENKPESEKEETDADKHTPKGENITVELNGDPKAPDGISNKDELPEGTKFEFVEKPDTSTPGDKPTKIEVTYPDQSEDIVDIVVTVKDKGGDTGDGDKGDGSGDGDNTPGDNTGDGDKDNGSGDGDKGDGDNTGGNDGNTTPGDGNNTDGNNTGDNTKKPDFSGLPEDDKDKDTSTSPADDANDKDKPSGSKVIDNGNKGGTDGNTNASHGGVKGGFKPVTPANPSRVNQAPTAPSGFTPITGPGVGTVLAGGSGAGKGAVVDTGGQVQESFWTKIANLFR